MEKIKIILLIAAIFAFTGCVYAENENITKRQEEFVSKTTDLEKMRKLQSELTELRKCDSDQDCILISGCYWWAVNKEEISEAQSIIDEITKIKNCEKAIGKEPLVGCHGSLCEVKPDSERCMQYDNKDECLVYCNIFDKNGFCQHACAKDTPCD